MGLLYEKERRAVKDKEMPSIKEADAFASPVAPVRRKDEEDIFEDWEELDDIDDILDEELDIIDEELDTEDLDDELI